MQWQTKSPELEQLCQHVFRDEDALGRGQLDAAQFKRALSQVLIKLSVGTLPPGSWFDHLFGRFDSDDDGLMSVKDFQLLVDNLHVGGRPSHESWQIAAPAAQSRSSLPPTPEVNYRVIGYLRDGGSEMVSARQSMPLSKESLPPQTLNPFSSKAAAGASLAHLYEVFGDQLLGEGAFGKVVTVRHRWTKERRACKWVALTQPSSRELVELEVSMLKCLDHVSLLRLHDVVWEREDLVALVTELCEGGALADRLAYHRSHLKRPMDEDRVASYLEQILSAAGYCHARGVLHRDLKPENVMFLTQAGDSPLKVIDFGLADKIDHLETDLRVEHAEREGTLGAVARFLAKVPGGEDVISTQLEQVAMKRAGTPHYMAPEVYIGRYGPKADIWSIGVITFEMLTSVHPFYIPSVDSFETVKAKILKGAPVDELSQRGVGSRAADVCRQMLEMDPDSRVGAHQALELPWFGSLLRTAQKGAQQLSAIEIIQAVRLFVASSALRQVALRMLARELAELQVRVLRTVFLHLDRDRDGVLSVQDLLSACRPGEAHAAEVHGLLGMASSVASLGLGYSDFCAALLPQRVAVYPAQLGSAFQRLDVHGIGSLTSRSLSEAGWMQGQGTLPPALLERAAIELRAAGDRLDGQGFVRLAMIAVVPA